MLAEKTPQAVLKPSLCDTLRPQVTERLLSEITERIVAAFQPQKVILFGSYAYGTPHDRSDVDLLVIMNSEKTSHQRVIAVTEVAEVAFLPMDILVRTPQEIKERLEKGDFFIKEILTRGRTLYSHDSP